MSEPARTAPDPMAREVGYLELLSALERPGCPVCRAANRSARRYLSALLWEFVNDPGTRDRLRAARGFCREHTAMAVDVADAEAGALGMAILYEDFLRRARADAARIAARAAGRGRKDRGRPDPERALASRAACPCCEAAARTADDALRLLGRAAPDTRVGRLARARGSGICLPHLGRGIARAETAQQVERLVEVFDRAAAEVGAELVEAIRKHDYRFADEPRGAEMNSWRRAAAWLAGQPKPETER